MKGLNIKAVVLGLMLGLGSPYIAMQIASNISIMNFLGEPIISWKLFLPPSLENWSNASVLGVLTQRLDSSGSYSCIHVIPIYPKYQVISVLPDNIKACCNTNNSLFVPAVNKDGFSDYYCGTYPNQQIVRVINSKENQKIMALK